MEDAVQRLTCELEDARALIQTKQEQLELSARIGKKLLEDNSEMATRSFNILIFDF